MSKKNRRFEADFSEPTIYLLCGFSNRSKTARFMRYRSPEKRSRGQYRDMRSILPLKKQKKELSVFEYQTCYFKNHHLLHKTKAQTEIMFELFFKSNKTFLQLLIITNIPVTCFNLANCLRHLLQRSTAQVDFSECHPCLGLISTEKVSPNVFFKYSEVCQRK